MLGRLLHFWTHALGALSDLLYPRHCLACGIDVLDPVCTLCGNCLRRIRFIDRLSCRRCGYPSGRYASAEHCSECELRRFAFAGATAACRYEGLARDLILQFKYGRRTILGGLFSELMVSRAMHPEVLEKVDRVIAVPLHQRKLRERGFNQSEILAKGIASRIGIRQQRGVLERTVETRSQTGLDREARSGNVRGAFMVKRGSNITGACVLLVDDVMTTGSTLSECADTLRKAGAGEVHVLVFARG